MDTEFTEGEEELFERRKLAHLIVHPANIGQIYIIIIHFALHSLFELVLEVHFIKEGTLYDTHRGVIQSYTRSGAQIAAGQSEVRRGNGTHTAVVFRSIDTCCC